MHEVGGTGARLYRRLNGPTISHREDGVSRGTWNERAGRHHHGILVRVDDEIDACERPRPQHAARVVTLRANHGGARLGVDLRLDRIDLPRQERVDSLYPEVDLRAGLNAIHIPLGDREVDLDGVEVLQRDRKSTRLNSSHVAI